MQSFLNKKQYFDFRSYTTFYFLNSYVAYEMAT